MITVSIKFKNAENAEKYATDLECNGLVGLGDEYEIDWVYVVDNIAHFVCNSNTNPTMLNDFLESFIEDNDI